jgi:Mg2+-importing ATPase
VVAAAIVLPFTPLGSVLGFIPPPLSFLAILVGMSFGYLLLVEASKRWLYARIRAA